MSKKCQNCGFELADNMNFCPQCHAKVEASAYGAPVPEGVSAGVGGQGGETVEYSDKSYSTFMMLSALPLLPFGQGLFYIKRPVTAICILLPGLGFLIACIISVIQFTTSGWDYGRTSWLEAMWGDRWGNFLAFVILWILQIVLAFFVKTDGDGKKLK